MNKDKITLGGKEYFIASSAYTQFAYKEFTGRSMLKDIQKLVFLQEKLDANKEEADSNSLSLVEKFSEMMLKLTYVMIREADGSQVGSYEDFLKGISTIFGDNTWVEKSMKLACLPISRQL